MAISKAMRAALKALSYPDIDLKKNYSSVRQVIRAAHPKAKDPLYRTWDHRVSCGDHDVPVRIFTPLDGLDHPMLLFFHGGGWVTGDIDSYDSVCTTLCRMTGHVVVSVDYRLAPEYRFPAAPEDCYAVARDIFQSSGSFFHISADDITLIGDSAGGNLAAVVSLMARDRGEFLPKKQVLLYPATHSEHSILSPFESIRENGTGYLLTSKRICAYLDLYRSDESDLRNPYFAPLAAKDLSNQPRTLILTAEYDPLRDEGEEYGRRLAAAGNQVEICRIGDALHGYFSLPTSYEPVRSSYVLLNHFLSGNEVNERACP